MDLHTSADMEMQSISETEEREVKLDMLEDNSIQLLENFGNVNNDFEIQYVLADNQPVEVTENDHNNDIDSDLGALSTIYSTDSESSSTNVAERQPPKKRARPKRKFSNYTKKAAESVGRKSDPIWQNFITTRSGDKIIKNVCKFCNQGVSARACRMTRHLADCSKKPKHLKKDGVGKSDNSPALECVPSSSSKLLAKDLQFPTVKTSVKKMEMKSFADRMSKEDKKELDLHLAKFIYRCNIPFNIVKNVSFKEFMEKVRPSYQLPTYDQLSHSLLDKCYEDTVENMKSKLKGAYATILQDGWSTNQHEAVISHSLSVDGRTFFLNAITADGNSKTAVYCKQKLLEAVRTAELSFGCTIVAVSTDNCSTMQLMRKLIKQEHPHLYVYGCNSHLLNLVGQKITPDDIMQKVIKVQKHFRNKDVTSAALKSLKGKRPTLPCQTRWNSQVDCLLNYKENNLKYLEISRLYNASIEDEILQIINDQELYSAIGSAIDSLQPICTALDKLQSDSNSVADAVRQWIILDKIDILHNDQHFKKYLEWGMEPTSIVAYMLHPKHRGHDLPKHFVERGRKWLAAVSPDMLIKTVQLHNNSTDVYPASLMLDSVREKMNPLLWWSEVSTWPEMMDISKLALKVLSMPASTAGQERIFSTMGSILSKTRNRLGIEKVQKLCAIYRAEPGETLTQCDDIEG